MGRPVSQQILIRDPSEGSSFSEPNVAAQLRGHSPVAISCDGSPSTHGQWNGGIADQIIPLEANIPNHVQNSIDQIPPKASVPNATLEDINHDWAWDGMDALTHTLSLTPPLLVSALFDQSNAPPESDAQLNSDSNSSNEQDRPLTGGNDSNALFNAEEEGSLWEPFVDLPFELPKSPDWFSSPGEL
jgi:hypothetical protein